ncbi:ABC transporter permease [Streptomyces sp. HNM0575]|uniref:ABC transporter permease n=1 Tax=Streptomyces sp. HNM0575 TaxID=2716338 RepID=UPI00145DFA97|nr:ABC transporter permease [Streptomyces sp. HNM0575]NLU71419.1 ABC transporter permease [Streptomyces sp. HNM0575]
MSASLAPVDKQDRQSPESSAPVEPSPARATLRSHNVPAPVLGVLALITGVMAFVNPSFLSPRNLGALAEQSAVPVVLAVGLTFVILMGGIDLSLEGTLAAVSLSTALLVANDRNGMDIGLWVIPAGCAVGALIGLLAGTSVALLRVPSFIVTIGTWQIGLGVAQLLFGSAPPRVTDPRFRGLAVDKMLGLPGIVWIAALVVVFGLVVQRYTRFGRYAYVIGGSEETALLSGIPVRRYRAASFVLAGAATGLAAVAATARSGVGEVSIGNGLLFTSIAGVVLGGTFLTGGRGGVLHSVIGVIVMVAIANAMVLAGISPYVQQAVQGAIVVTAAVATMWRARQRLRVIK